ncbi:polysaccharide pyruvyl transferase family protein [Segatella bryantii]|uniref:polysaccharide pyruvyl transferase family protein n=1 Tax=Segatella bryantii TaxID=77095 RepID=UPI00241BFC3B|nr:polysaccharide pyruvyl transferase family protein [Segatella bryantii]
MKIGILTFQSSHNCGSMLQAYALQHTLSSRLQAKAELINYSNRASRDIYGYIDLRPRKSSIKSNYLRFLNFNTVRKSRKEYNDFARKYLVQSSKRLFYSWQLKTIVRDYDLLVAGGDQIWNVRCPDAGKEYYLDFANDVPKVSYSPSLGGSNIFKFADNIDTYKHLLDDFKLLSVREPNGKYWLENLTKRKVEIICDPTLLLTKKDWFDLFDLPEDTDKYIFNYSFYHNDAHVNKHLAMISKKLNMPVVIMDHKQFDYYHLEKFGFIKSKHTGPKAFLSLMKNASLVLTQSFHGTLFAALFNKRFWSYNIDQYYSTDDDRAISILKQLGLEDKYVLIEDLTNLDLMKDINFSIVNKNINELRNKGLAYIDQFSHIVDSYNK